MTQNDMTPEILVIPPHKNKGYKRLRGWLSRKFRTYGGLATGAGANMAIHGGTNMVLLSGTKMGTGLLATSTLGLGAAATMALTTVAVGGVAGGIAYYMLKRAEKQKRQAAEEAGSPYNESNIAAKAFISGVAAMTGFAAATVITPGLALLGTVSAIAIGAAALNHVIDRHDMAYRSDKKVKFWAKEGDDPSLTRKALIAGSIGAAFTLVGIAARAFLGVEGSTTNGPFITNTAEAAPAPDTIQPSDVSATMRSSGPTDIPPVIDLDQSGAPETHDHVDITEDDTPLTTEAPVSVEMAAFDTFTREYMGEGERSVESFILNGLSDKMDDTGLSDETLDLRDKILGNLAALQDMKEAHEAGQPIDVDKAAAHIKELGHAIRNNPCDIFPAADKELGNDQYFIASDMGNEQGKIGATWIKETNQIHHYQSQAENFPTMADIADTAENKTIANNAHCFDQAWNEGDYSLTDDQGRCEEPVKIPCPDDKPCAAAAPQIQSAVNTTCTVTNLLNGLHDVEADCTISSAESLGGPYEVEATSTCTYTDAQGHISSDEAQCSALTKPVDSFSDLTPKHVAAHDTPFEADAACAAIGIDDQNVTCTSYVTENYIEQDGPLVQYEKEGTHILPNGHVSAECTISEREIGIKEARRDGSEPLWILPEFKELDCTYHDETTKPGDTIHVTINPRTGASYDANLVFNMGAPINTQGYVEGYFTDFIEKFKNLEPANNTQYFECGEKSCRLKPAI